MKISKIESPNFQAKMDISKFDKYRHYWGEVADNFAKKTADKEATLSFRESFCGMTDIEVKFPSKISDRTTSAYIMCFNDNFTKLTNEAPSKVADKLSKVFTYLSNAVEEREITLFNTVSNITTKNEVLPFKIFEDINKKMIGVRDKIMTNVNFELNNNEDLNGFQIII